MNLSVAHPCVFAPIIPARIPSVPGNSAQPSGLYLHRTLENAMRHKKYLEEFTGDRCQVSRFGSKFWVVRYDPGGKMV